eukprot:CAMPEP_0172715000 /NCGR_PEP_ID=MMETSP1074-20121228/67290_1 /TAXON_ID=2916 /ORGANISM="Ceratium fusus, Strain PA161109" /LENGTH=498 /DNA_ID=CAMNT_0013539531 /DNA_START=70 /DNA_END=1563 /DNA_ORIENTATION=-
MTASNPSGGAAADVGNTDIGMYPAGRRTGLMSSLSDRLATQEEASLIVALRRELAKDLAAAPQFPELIGDIRLLRTLRAMDHDVGNAAKAFRRHLLIRRHYNIDEKRQQLAREWGGRLWELSGADLPNGNIICRYIPETIIFSVGKSGDPVSLSCWGKSRPAEMIREVSDWDQRFLEYFIYQFEAKAMLLDEASRAQNRLVHFLCVFDLHNWNFMGNSDRIWARFCTETTGPVGETYHDFNRYFFAIRVTHMAKLAYKMMKPYFPKKVTDKVFIFGDDFANDDELHCALDKNAISALSAGCLSASTCRREGRATIRPRGSFELRVEVPHGSALRWSFGTECSEWHGCSLGASTDIIFSLSRCSARVGDAEHSTYVHGWGPQLVEGHRVQGSIDQFDGNQDSSCMVMLRWSNGNSWITSRALHYRVEVTRPIVDLPIEVVPTKRSSSGACTMILLATLACSVAAALGRVALHDPSVANTPVPVQPAPSALASLHVNQDG